MRSRARAYSFIELLVVVGIIVVLMAIILPISGVLRESSRRSACLSNLRQFGQAATLYSTDFDQIYLPARVGPKQRNLPGAACYVDLLNPYIKEIRLWRCPSAEPAVNVEKFLAVGPEDLSISPSITFAPEITMSMANYRSTPVAVSEVVSPSNFIVATDAQPMVHETLSHSAWTTNVAEACQAAMREREGALPDALPPEQKPFFRHSLASNFVFADGSTRHLKPMATLTPNLMWYADHRALARALAAKGRGPVLTDQEDCLAIIAP